MDPFVLKVLLSFIVGGLWTIVATVLADKYGTKIGGFIAGLPSTILLGLFFIAWTQNPRAAVEATTMVPIVGGIGYLFLAVYAYLVRKSLYRALIFSFLLWFMLVFWLVRGHFSNYPVSLFSYCLALVLSWLLEYPLQIKSLPGQKIKYTPKIILLRSLLSGSIIALAVWLAKIGGPLLGGAFATFPAMFTSMLLITYFAQGPVFSAALTKSLMLSSITVIIYSMGVRFTYLPLGIIWGTSISMLISFISGLFIYRFAIKKLS